jgi:hypothetical protein
MFLMEYLHFVYMSDVDEKGKDNAPPGTPIPDGDTRHG